MNHIFLLLLISEFLHFAILEIIDQKKNQKRKLYIKMVVEGEIKEINIALWKRAENFNNMKSMKKSNKETKKQILWTFANLAIWMKSRTVFERTRQVKSTNNISFFWFFLFLALLFYFSPTFFLLLYVFPPFLLLPSFYFSCIFDVTIFLSFFVLFFNNFPLKSYVHV